jgi:hypothetical protein
VTSSECDACHSTIAWLPATFDHSSSSGICDSCHNNLIAIGKDSNHFITSQQCDVCHTAQSWLPVSYTHAIFSIPAGHTGKTCVDCHKGNSESSGWSNINYKPDCAGCHAGNWEAGPHKKTENPSLILYTVSELRDCTTSCHIYTDDTFMTVDTPRDSQHRATDGNF